MLLTIWLITALISYIGIRTVSVHTEVRAHRSANWEPYVELWTVVHSSSILTFSLVLAPAAFIWALFLGLRVVFDDYVRISPESPLNKRSL